MKKIHFIAIGGAIMHQLAIALHKKGFQVSGSDDEINDPARANLQAEGLLPPEAGWFPERLNEGVTEVVLGMHARADNPELLAAQKAGIPVYSFPRYVYELSKKKTRVVVAGSHGKTTITSMIMHILRHLGRDFDYLVGARVPGFEQSVRLTDAPVIIIEGDEYPASPVEKRPKIFFYHPHITVISGIAWDHINVFPTYENYFSQFEQYLAMLENGTRVIYNSEDTEVVRLIQENETPGIECTPYATPAFAYRDGSPVITTGGVETQLSVFGRHNVQNVQAAIEVCMALGASLPDCMDAIADFTGAARRLEKIREDKDLLIYRDFAHAPSKLRATLAAVREAYPNHKLVACFELHTFSSLNDAFLSEYRGTMDPADTAIVYFSHHALTLKGLPPLSKEAVRNNFGRQDVIVEDAPDSLQATINHTLTLNHQPVFLLLMSSGTFDGINWNNISTTTKQ